MKDTKFIMGMPVTVEIADPSASTSALDKVFSYFRNIDERFSPFKETSEISRINRGELGEGQYSYEMCAVFELSQQTKEKTNGFFDIQKPDGSIDPSGLVKGRTIWQTAIILQNNGFKNFYIDAGGDVQAFGRIWKVGIKNPFKQNEIIKVLNIKDLGVATSGTYIRGQHIYNPHQKGQNIEDIVSLTVVGPNIFEADRFATAAFAMGRQGIEFIENFPDLEGYMIDKNGIGTETSGFNKYA